MTYRERKTRARALVIDWQKSLVNIGPLNRSWGYFITWAGRWKRIGRKYGLIREFKENGIL